MQYLTDFVVEPPPKLDEEDVGFLDEQYTKQKDREAERKQQDMADAAAFGALPSAFSDPTDTLTEDLLANVGNSDCTSPGSESGGAGSQRDHSCSTGGD